MKRLAILGASGHGKVVAEIAELDGWSVIFFDDAYPNVSKLEYWSILGTTTNLIEQIDGYDGCFVAIGNNNIRLEKVRLLQSTSKLVTLVHPSAIISRYSRIGEGSVVMAGAIINPFVSVGVCCIINTGVTVDHDCLLGDAVHLSPGSHIAGGVKIGDKSWVGIGASIKQCIQIGSNVTIGSGAAVISDIPDGILAVGVPAKDKNKMEV